MKSSRVCVLAACALGSALVVSAIDTKADPSPTEIQDIIKKFTQKETEFSAARENYTYRQTSKLSETDPPGGAYEIVDEVSFDHRSGRRIRHGAKLLRFRNDRDPGSCEISQLES